MLIKLVNDLRNVNKRQWVDSEVHSEVRETVIWNPGHGEGCLLKFRDIYLYLTYIFWDFHLETANISLGDRKYCWGISLLSGLTQRSLHQWSNIYIYQHIHHPSLILIHQNQDRAVYLLIQTQWRRIEGAPASRMCIVIILSLNKNVNNNEV